VDDIEFIGEPTMEERPYFFEFKKCELVGHHPMWPKLTYDPFPDAGMDDVVRREIIGRELIFRAKLKIADIVKATEIRPGKALNYGPHKFAVIESTINFEPRPNNSSEGAIVDVVGSEFLTPIEPLENMRRLREMLAASNPK
jgi:hypothetical protein